jgi:hypothetical protein
MRENSADTTETTISEKDGNCSSGQSLSSLEYAATTEESDQRKGSRSPPRSRGSNSTERHIKPSAPSSVAIRNARLSLPHHSKEEQNKVRPEAKESRVEGNTAESFERIRVNRTGVGGPDWRLVFAEAAC